MIGSGKAGHIIHDSRFDFSSRTQSYMNKLSNFIIKSAKLDSLLEWSAFASYFSQAQWQSVHVLWGINGALVPEVAIYGCTALWC